jgi:hypothetical protein
MTRAQVVYNMLNPSAATELVSNYPAQDYGRLFDHATAADVGVVGIRVLAGGALSGSTERHPIGPGARSDPGRRADQSRWLLGANPRFGRAAPGTAAGRALFSCRIVTV